jgi:hypothetical protein
VPERAAGLVVEDQLRGLAEEKQPETPLPVRAPKDELAGALAGDRGTAVKARPHELLPEKHAEGGRRLARPRGLLGLKVQARKPRVHAQEQPLAGKPHEHRVGLGLNDLLHRPTAEGDAHLLADVGELARGEAHAAPLEPAVRILSIAGTFARGD